MNTTTTLVTAGSTHQSIHPSNPTTLLPPRTRTSRYATKRSDRSVDHLPASKLIPYLSTYTSSNHSFPSAHPPMSPHSPQHCVLSCRRSGGGAGYFLFFSFLLSDRRVAMLHLIRDTEPGRERASSQGGYLILFSLFLFFEFVLVLVFG